MFVCCVILMDEEKQQNIQTQHTLFTSNQSKWSAELQQIVDSLFFEMRKSGKYSSKTSYKKRKHQKHFIWLSITRAHLNAHKFNAKIVRHFSVVVDEINLTIPSPREFLEFRWLQFVCHLCQPLFIYISNINSVKINQCQFVHKHLALDTNIDTDQNVWLLKIKTRLSIHSFCHVSYHEIYVLNRNSTSERDPRKRKMETKNRHQKNMLLAYDFHFYLCPKSFACFIFFFVLPFLHKFISNWVPFSLLSLVLL